MTMVISKVNPYMVQEWYRKIMRMVDDRWQSVFFPIEYNSAEIPL
jgi:hypothetical protein